ncbi:MAG: YihY/virulence factor BrkB family protein [Ilumatobacteraceae bacterium]
MTADFATAADVETSNDDRGRNAESPLQIPKLGWKDILLRVKDEWGGDNVGLSAAAVAFYAFLALIPALAAMVSILGLVAQGQDATKLINDLFGALPGDAKSLIDGQLQAISDQSSNSLSFGLVIGIALSIWSASGAVGQLMSTINIAYDEEETRSWFLRKGLALALTLGAVLFVALAIFAVVGLPVLIERTGFGIGMRRLLNILIWPGLAIMFGLALTVLYRISPDRRDAHWKWVTVGSIFAIVAWVVVTLGFRFYVSAFGSYNKTYGSLSAVVVMLLWLWLTSIIVLLGAEINAETEHQTARDTTVGGDQPIGQRGAVKADTVGKASD